jgi:8-oxo-dGTP diphosphatase
MPLIVVAAALIDTNRTILIQKRPDGGTLAGLWEFPGGKREAGESSRAALVRELDEELGIAVYPDDLMPCGFVVEPRERGELILLLFACHRWRGVAAPLTASELRWVEADALAGYAMPPADVPLAAGLVRYLSGV